MVEAPLEQAVDFAASVGATAKLESYQMTMVQQTTSMDGRSDVVQVGPDSSRSSRLGSHVTETRFVDGQVYELDADTWYPKPTPARLVVATTLSDFTNSLRELPATEIRRTSNTLTVRITCGSDDRALANESVVLFCDDRTTSTAVVDLESGLLASVRIEGELEVYPGRYEEGFIEVDAIPSDPLEPIEAPLVVDRGRADCISEMLDASDYAVVSELLDGTTTEENRVIFNDCGFAVFPPGIDFQSTE